MSANRVGSPTAHFASVDDPSLVSLSLYSEKPIMERYDVYPFMGLYLVSILAQQYCGPIDELYYYWVAATALLVITIIVHVLVLLSGYWNINFRLKMAYTPLPVEKLYDITLMTDVNARKVYLEGALVAKSEHDSALGRHTFWENLHEARVKQMRAAHEKNANRAPLVLPDPPAKPTMPIAPVVIDSRRVYVHVVPVEHSGSPTLCGLEYDDKHPGSYYFDAEYFKDGTKGTNGARPPPFVFSSQNIRYFFTKTLAFHQENQRIKEKLITNQTIGEDNKAKDDISSAADAADVDVDFQVTRYPDDKSILHYINSKPNATTSLVPLHARYGLNLFEILPPTFVALFIQHAMAPFFVFQIFCVGLWMLDEYWYYSLFTLFMLVLFEVMVVYRRKTHLKDIMNMRPPATYVWVYRTFTRQEFNIFTENVKKSNQVNSIAMADSIDILDNITVVVTPTSKCADSQRPEAWIKVNSEEIYPGDIISLSRHIKPSKTGKDAEYSPSFPALDGSAAAAGDADDEEDANDDVLSQSEQFGVVPCDCVLLHGTCVVNEAMLTGESVPQIKEPITDILTELTNENDEDVGNNCNGDASTSIADVLSAPLSVNKTHRRSIVFGGTKILTSSVYTPETIVIPEAYAPRANVKNAKNAKNAKNVKETKEKEDINNAAVSTLSPIDDIDDSYNSTSLSLDTTTPATAVNSAITVTSNPVQVLYIPSAPDGGVPASVIRTGFGSFQGSLVRTILFSAEASGATNREALYFILVLLVFAIASASYVLREGLLDETRSRYKIMLNVITILTSVVPPELPMQLSLAVNNSLTALMKLQIFCTEPFRIPDAGAVDVVCFDKTGTLTSNNFLLLGIGGVKDLSNDNEGSDAFGIDDTTASATSSVVSTTVPTASAPSGESDDIIPEDIEEDVNYPLVREMNASTLSLSTLLVMGSCHSLAVVEDTIKSPVTGQSKTSLSIVGDPMEKVVFASAGFITKAQHLQQKYIQSQSQNNTSTNTHSTRTTRKPNANVDLYETPESERNVVMSERLGISSRIIQRFAFSSNKKRMSCLVHVTRNQGEAGKSVTQQKKTSNAVQSIVNTYSIVAKGAPEVMESLFLPSSMPKNYTATHRHFAMKGCRVLALGHKPLPNHRESTIVSRNDAESELMFTGFLILQSPLKKDSAKVVEELASSSHKVIMITGDHILTACHVAKEVGIMAKKKPILQLQLIAEPHPNQQDQSQSQSNLPSTPAVVLPPKFSWVPLTSTGSASSSSHLPFTLTRSSIDSLVRKYELCMTGNALEAFSSYVTTSLLQQDPDFINNNGNESFASSSSSSASTSASGSISSSSRLMAYLYYHTSVFARTMPEQKEHILYWLRAIGHTTVMCGDGTNDVGALKKANVGIALLATDGSETPASLAAELELLTPQQRAKYELRKKKREEKAKWRSLAKNPFTKRVINQLEALQREHHITPPGARRSEIERRMQKLHDSIDKIQKQAQNSGFGSVNDFDMGDEATAKLGDASIAAPFTAKHASVRCVLDILRQGRCTLVSTMQMYQILALNCLISAYSMSVLYIQGVKMGEAQMTIAGMSATAFFLFVSRAKPIEQLSPERPNARIFSPWMITTVLVQFAIHLVTLIIVSSMALPYVIDNPDAKDPEGKFMPNVLNTVIFFVSVAQTAATFLANYRGRPFMESLKENSGLYKALIITLLIVAVLANEFVPEINEQMELVSLPDNMRNSVVLIVLLDVALSVGIAQFLTNYFSIIPPRVTGVETEAVSQEPRTLLEKKRQ